jgi:hypothetical protein
MAKGKYGARAAIRRYEAALDVTDRLTDRLTEQKAKARQYEADAIEAKSLRRRCSDLEAQLHAEMTPRYEDLQRSSAAEIERLTQAVELLKTSVETMVEVVSHHPAFASVSWIPTVLVERRAELGLQLRLPGHTNREHRRAQTYDRTAGDRKEHVPQDNRRTSDENVDGKFAHPMTAGKGATFSATLRG